MPCPVKFSEESEYAVNIREFHEKREQQQLAGWAALSVDSKGRRVPEPSCGIRTDYQRDRDRILYSKAFRRLMHKAQVFISPEGDHFRTRLTHTLDVAQISRSIARALRLNEDLAEAIALGHDLGHAPFGHTGEAALDEMMNRYASGEGFRHNEQSLRVVEFLENGGKGLNLTWEVRDGILKHTKGRSGLAAGEEESALLPATAEGRIVRIADRFAYINHDIDDAFRAGILCAEDLPSHIVSIMGSSISDRIGAMVTDVIETSLVNCSISMSSSMAKMVEDLKEFMFERVYTDPIAKAEEGKAKRLVQSLFVHYMENPSRLSESPLRESDGLARRVCDYIAGMSDRYAISSYEEIFVPKVLDLQ